MSFHNGRPGRGWRRGPTFRDRRAEQAQPAGLPPIILEVLAEQPRTGFHTMQALAGRRCPGDTASAMAVYPALMGLEEAGLVSAAPDDAGRRLYSLTDAGRRLHLLTAAEAATSAANRPPAGRHRRPRCCQRTAAAIAASLSRTAGAGVTGRESAPGCGV